MPIHFRVLLPLKCKSPLRYSSLTLAHSLLQCALIQVCSIAIQSSSTSEVALLSSYLANPHTLSVVCINTTKVSEAGTQSDALPNRECLMQNCNSWRETACNMHATRNHLSDVNGLPLTCLIRQLNTQGLLGNVNYYLLIPTVEGSSQVSGPRQMPSLHLQMHASIPWLPQRARTCNKVFLILLLVCFNHYLENVFTVLFSTQRFRQLLSSQELC